jgi:hypothetical protein
VSTFVSVPVHPSRIGFFPGWESLGDGDGSLENDSLGVFGEKAEEGEAPEEEEEDEEDEEDEEGTGLQLFMRKVGDL